MTTTKYEGSYSFQTVGLVNGVLYINIRFDCSTFTMMIEIITFGARSQSFGRRIEPQDRAVYLAKYHRHRYAVASTWHLSSGKHEFKRKVIRFNVVKGCIYILFIVYASQVLRRHDLVNVSVKLNTSFTKFILFKADDIKSTYFENKTFTQC